MEKLSTDLSIKEISQIDNKSFFILWGDGKKSVYRIEELQYHCPCIKCRNSKEKIFFKDLAVILIKSVGNYAIKVQFNKGCSAGIYTYEYLKKIQTC